VLAQKIRIKGERTVEVRPISPQREGEKTERSTTVLEEAISTLHIRVSKTGDVREQRNHNKGRGSYQGMTTTLRKKKFGHFKAAASTFVLGR